MILIRKLDALTGETISSINLDIDILLFKKKVKTIESPIGYYKIKTDFGFNYVITNVIY